MDALSLQTITDYAAGTMLQGEGSRVVTRISTDSRQAGPGELFLALRGGNFDGHEFIEALPSKGCVGAIVEVGARRGALPPDFALIEVPETLTAYQAIAGRYRWSLALKLVAITGSNGKTSTKDLTAALLGSERRVLKTSGNFNNHVGVPKTLLEASHLDEVAVLEIGMNHPGEIAPLAAIARPDLAIITNIGTAHIEHMKTRAAIALEKGVLAESVGSSGHVVLPAEDEFTPAIGRRTAATKITVGFTRGEIRAENLRPGETGTTFTLRAEGQTWEAMLPVPGKHMVLNGLLAVATARVYGISWERCLASLATVRLTKGRLERKTAGRLNFLDDSYNANPDSVVAAVETLARLPTQGRRIAVLGRMGELGEESEAGHLRVGEAAARERLDQLLVIGEEGRTIARGAKSAGAIAVVMVTDVESAADWLRENARPEDLILIKGSRSARLERITALLDSRTAEAVN